MKSFYDDLLTIPVNMAGLPGISVPCGLDKNGMPIGMQLIGKHFDEETIIRAAYAYEQETKFREKLNEAYPDTPLEDWTVWKPIFREDILQRIVDVVEQGKKVPIRFSESKPERVVDLYKEVQYVLVPSNDFKKAQQIVEWTELEWKLVEYTPDNHTAPRSRKIKELQKRYWNIFLWCW